MAKKAKAKDSVVSMGDDAGNLLVIRNNGARLILSLKLRAEDRYRRVGVVNLSRKTLEVKRSRDKHLFRMNSSYGFNHKLLEEAKSFDKIRLKDEFSEWKIPTKFILENGSFLHFQGQGFELQTFVTLQQIEQFKRPVKV